MQVPPALPPVVAFATGEGAKALRPLLKWFKTKEMGQRDVAYAPLDLRSLDGAPQRTSALMRAIAARYAAENRDLADSLAETRGELARLRADLETLQQDLFDTAPGVG